MTHLESAHATTSRVENFEKQTKVFADLSLTLLDSASLIQWKEMKAVSFSNHDANSILNNGFSLFDNSRPEALHQTTEAKDAVHDKAEHKLNPKWENEKKQFAKDHGVDIVEKNGKLEYHIRGHKEVLFTEPANEKGLEAANKKLDELVKQKEAELHIKYGATFSENAETAGKQHILVNGKWVDGPDDVQCRAPNISEMSAIEAALKHSQPNAHGIKFYITTNDLDKNEGSDAIYSQVPKGGSDKSATPGSPAIFINEQRSAHELPNDQPGHVPHNDRAHVPDTLQWVMTHELVHHSQKRMGGKDDPDSSHYAQKLATEMGWVSPTPPTSDTNQWLLEDKKGHFWKKEKFDGDQWIQVDKTGHPIDAHHHRVPGAKAVHCNSDTMMENAKVKPYTNYFDQPAEMEAEAMAAYRTGGTDRAALAHNNPRLYKTIRHADQEEINKDHPVDKVTGKSTYYRDNNGNVVPVPKAH